MVLSTSRERGDENAAKNQRTAEFHFGRSTPGDVLPRRIRRHGCGMVAVLPTYVNGSDSASVEASARRAFRLRASRRRPGVHLQPCRQ
jgi:hypothetical protein